MKQCPNCKVYRLAEDSPIKVCTHCQEAKKKWYRKRHGENGRIATLATDKFIRKAF